MFLKNLDKPKYALLQVPTIFLRYWWSIPVFPPIEASHIARSVVEY